MANPVRIKVVYNEEETRTEQEIEDELKKSISELEGITSVSFERGVTDVQAPEGIVTVEFNEGVTDSSTISYNISTLPFVHNALVLR